MPILSNANINKSKKYKIKTIDNSVMYSKELKLGSLQKLYYLIL